MVASSSPGFLVTLLVVNGIVVCLSAIVLVVAMPERIRRKVLETGALADCWANVVLIISIALVPTNLIVWVVHTQYIPLNIGMDAMEEFDTDPQIWRDNLNEHGVRLRHDRSLRDRGMTAEDAEAVQRDLWDNWVVIVALGVLVVLASIYLMSRAYVAMLRDLDANADKHRLQEDPAGPLDKQPWEYAVERLLQDKRSKPGCRTRRRGTRHERIAVLRDDFAMQILDSISAEGPEYVLHELSGLHELGHHEIANELHHEGDDETYEMDGYILTWNSRRKYVSLDYQLDDIHSVSRSR